MISDALNRGLNRLKQIRESLSQSPIAYRLARGAFWSMLGGVASRIFTMVSSVIVARILGKQGFGEVGMVQSTLGLFGILAGFGLGSTATKYIAEYRHKDPEKAGRISSLTIIFALLSSALMMLLCIALSPWLAERSLGRPELASLLAAGSLLLFISTIGGVMLAALSGYEAFRQIAKINIIQGAASPFISIPLVWAYGVQGAIASFTITAALGLFLSAVAFKGESDKNNIPAKFTRSIWREWPVLLNFAFPAMMSGLVAVPVMWVTNVILVNQPGGYGELGLFNAANQWRTVIIFLPGLLSSAMLPVLSETHSREDRTDFRRTVGANLHITWILALPLTVIVIIFCRPLAAIYGSQFRGTDSVIVVLMLSVFLNVINATVGIALAGSGRMWTGTMMNFGWALILIVSSLQLIPHFGAKGLATAYFVAYLFHTIWTMAYVEIKLAPTAITGRWLLIVFSLFVLGVSTQFSIENSISYGYRTLLIPLSFIPLAGALRNGAYKAFGQDWK